MKKMRCSTCKKMLPMKKFGVGNKIVDGRPVNGMCKPCRRVSCKASRERVQKRKREAEMKNPTFMTDAEMREMSNVNFHGSAMPIDTARRLINGVGRVLDQRDKLGELIGQIADSSKYLGSGAAGQARVSVDSRMLKTLVDMASPFQPKKAEPQDE